MINYIVKLYKEGRELALLEIAYFTITILAFIVAAVISLFNQSFGVSALIVPLITLIAGVVNIVAWSIVKLVVEKIAGAKNDKKLGTEIARKTTKK